VGAMAAICFPRDSLVDWAKCDANVVELVDQELTATVELKTHVNDLTGRTILARTLCIKSEALYTVCLKVDDLCE